MIINTTNLDSLSPADAAAFRRFYRILRIRTPYTAPNSPDSAHVFTSSAGVTTHTRKNGLYYGLSREKAKLKVLDFAKEVDWYGYLGSK